MIKDNSGIRKTDVINRRMFVIGAAKLIVFSGIVARLFSLQINDNKKYLTLSDKNRIREWKLPPIRGEFHDYFGNIIAGNYEAYQLHVIPEQVENFRYVITRLKDILDFIFNNNPDYLAYLINSGFTFILYPLFYLIFNYLDQKISLQPND